MLAGEIASGKCSCFHHIFPAAKLLNNSVAFFVIGFLTFPLLFQFFFFRVKFFPYLVNVAGANVLCIEYRRKNNRASEIAYLFMMNVFGMNLNILNHRCTSSADANKSDSMFLKGRKHIRENYAAV